jgi:translation initiation factor 3 subunit I
MRPILLKGHERSITCVVYNRDGDLIFTAAKDGRPTLWLSEDGTRVGTYEVHNGAVWHLDVSWDSKLLVSGSADMHAKIWDVESGVELTTFEHTGSVRSCTFDESGRRILVHCDAFGGLDQNRPPLVSIYENEPMFGDVTSWRRAAQFQLPHPEAGEVKCGLVRWMPLGKQILCAFEDGALKIMDSMSFSIVHEIAAHGNKIQCLSFNAHQTFLLSASTDMTCKMWDLETWDCVKTYKSDRPLNACVFSPTKEHVLVGGGQDAMSVTTTSGKQGKFDTEFFYSAYQEVFGKVKGHFGPINALAIDPQGKSFCSGAEDGYIRLHHFDADYLAMKDPVPEDDLAAE